MARLHILIWLSWSTYKINHMDKMYTVPGNKIEKMKKADNSDNTHPVAPATCPVTLMLARSRRGLAPLTGVTLATWSPPFLVITSDVTISRLSLSLRSRLMTSSDFLCRLVTSPSLRARPMMWDPLTGELNVSSTSQVNVKVVVIEGLTSGGSLLKTMSESGDV